MWIKIIECTPASVDIFIILIHLMGNHYHVSDRQDKKIGNNKKKHQSILEIDLIIWIKIVQKLLATELRFIESFLLFFQKFYDFFAYHRLIFGGNKVFLINYAESDSYFLHYWRSYQHENYTKSSKNDYSKFTFVAYENILSIFLSISDTQIWTYLVNIFQNR